MDSVGNIDDTTSQQRFIGLYYLQKYTKIHFQSVHQKIYRKILFNLSNPIIQLMAKNNIQYDALKYLLNL